MIEQVDRQSVGQFLIVAAVLLIAIWLLTRRQFRRGAATSENITPREKIERLKQVGGTRNDLRQLMVEIEEMARRVGSQLDVKAHRLEKLLQEADQKLQQLNVRLPQSSEGESAAPPTPTAPPVDPLTAQVYALADEGRNSVEIAQQLDEQVGKVELMLALRQTSV